MILVTVLSVLVPASVAAQRYNFVGETEVAHYAGTISVDDIIPSTEETPLEDVGYDLRSMSAERGVGVGFRLARHVGHHWTLEASWSYLFSHLEARFGSGSDTDDVTYDRLGIVQYGVGLLYYPFWFADERIGPFIRVGAGGLSWRPSDDFPLEARPVATRRTAGLSGDVGGGLTFYATEDLSFRADYAWISTELNRDALLALSFPFPEIGSRNLSAHRLELGFTLRLFDTRL